MGATFKKQSNTAKREPIPEGQYDVRCYGVVELGTHTTISPKWGEKTNEKIMLLFEFPELPIEYEQDGKKVSTIRAIYPQFNNSMGEKANLRIFLEAWRGKKFTDEDAQSFDVSKCIGHGACVSIQHNGEFANIATISPLHKSVKLPPQHNESINFGICDIDTPEWDKLYPWMQEKIKASHEYLAKEMAGEGEQQSVDVEEEDIPF